MAASDTPDSVSSVAGIDMPASADEPGIGDIVERLRTPIANRVTRARLWVEREVPPSERGPGWDRHWRELEAYCEAMGTWSTRSE